jgi:hypothetical protein
MPKVKSEDILKPDAVLEVKLIDWTDPEVKEAIRIMKKENAKLKRIKVYRYEPKR